MSEPEVSINLSQIGQIALNVKDLERAIEFYKETLGMTFLFSAPNMAFFNCGGVRLMLAPAEKPAFDHPASLIYYKVDDIRRTHQSLCERNVTFESEPHCIHKTEQMELWMAFFRDSEGNLLAMMEEVQKG